MKPRIFALALVSLTALMLLPVLPAAGQEAGRPMGGHMMTRWAGDVSADAPWPEYPRPQMVRKEWKNLNGQWDYAIVAKADARPAEWDGRILVPFCVESALSGVRRNVALDEKLWYRRSFEVPAGWKGQRVILRFGAVDWEADVFINGHRLGRHRGGYTPFSFDITGYLKPGASQELLVSVWDPTDQGTQPRGKQVNEPRGIWYTAVTGIWQTVWLEPVPEVSIDALKAVPDIDKGVLRLTVTPSAPAESLTVEAVATDGGAKVGEASGPAGQPLELAVRNAKLWSPESPHLYDLKVTMSRAGQVVDEVDSYFGMRKSSLGKDQHGNLRMMLNNKPYFQLGPLDQGWWPDGLYTAPTDEALRFDIEATKKLGFNMARKHVKVEPARWYYHCDKLGLLVWQDMPSAMGNNGYGGDLFVRPGQADGKRDGVSAAQFEGELKEMMDSFHNFPSIVVWVPFNEGWGQYDTQRVAGWVGQYDPSRLVNATSGWEDRGAGDMYDTHMYPGPGMEDAGPGRATVLGEFGGHGLPVTDHLWWNKRNWGYRTFTDRATLHEQYLTVVSDVEGLIGFGLSAAVYTQTTDVEGEVNGLMTYDRAVVKFDAGELTRIHQRLYQASRKANMFLADSEKTRHPWLFVRGVPAGDWTSPEFDDGNWMSGTAPFQSGLDELFPTGTKWESGAIWTRRSFTLTDTPANLWMKVLHGSEKGALYINGQKVFDFSDTRPTSRHYRHADISEFAGALRQGKNVIAIQSEAGAGDGHSIDVGLYTLE